MTQALTTFDVSRRLRLSERKVRQLVRTGQIPYIALPGGDIRFDGDELDQWMRRLRVRVPECAKS